MKKEEFILMHISNCIAADAELIWFLLPESLTK